MTKVVTIDVPDFDDYTVEDVDVGNNAHVTRQQYFKDKRLVAEADIHFAKDDKDQPLKWPYKFIFKDHTHTGQVVVSSE